MMGLRPYQQEAVNAINEHWKEWRKELLVLPTGCGKTRVFNTIAHERDKVLILAHREELIEQARDAYESLFGVRPGKIKAAEEDIRNVTVGSIQTMTRRNYSGIFDTIIIDEAHHAVSDSYLNVLNQFPNAKVLGVTATADRSDKRSLSSYFDGIAYEYSLRTAIEEGYLCPIVARTVPLEIDMSEVKISVGDFELTSIAKMLTPYLPKIAEAIRTYAADRKTVVFCPLISIAQELASMIPGAREVNGNSPDRKETLEWFNEAGKGAVLTNAMLLCLDTETEILTSRGFLRYNEMTLDDEVANWNFDGTVFFKKPEEIVCRPLDSSEHMVSVDSRRINFRVTNTHRMIIGCGANKLKWKKIPAQDLANYDVLPSCGIAEPLPVHVKQENRTRSRNSIRSCVYHLVKAGMSRNEAWIEALKRAETNAALRHKDPSDLTLDECRFIGFWVADGTKNHLVKGGVEYIVVQSHRYMNICNWFDNVIANCGYDYLKKTMPPSTKTTWRSYKWSFPRGTGSGSQKRNGLYPIEPYLCKDGSSLLWGLNEKQFDAFLEGYWYGDGWHGTAENGFPSRIHATDTNKKFIDLLCALGSVRGWSCSIQIIPQKNPKHNTQYGITMIKGRRHCMSHKTKITHEPFKPEMVWCVRTESKNIITRRHGKVTVMGNTEGWDCPSVDCVVMLRPTKVRSLYSQCCGRGTRLYPGKKDLLLLDFLWLCQRHNLCRPASLVCENEDDVKHVVKQTTANEIDLFGAVADAEEARRNALAEALRKQARKKERLVDPLTLFDVLDDMALADYSPSFAWEMEDATDKQINLLHNFGIDGEGLTKGYASLVLDKVLGRSNKKMATVKQIKLLKKFRYNPTNWTYDQASAKITALSRVGWCRWKLRD